MIVVHCHSASGPVVVGFYFIFLELLMVFSSPFRCILFYFLFHDSGIYPTYGSGGFSRILTQSSIFRFYDVFHFPSEFHQHRYGYPLMVCKSLSRFDNGVHSVQGDIYLAFAVVALQNPYKF
jgi:hypothetical protein